MKLFAVFIVALSVASIAGDVPDTSERFNASATTSASDADSPSNSSDNEVVKDTRTLVNRVVDVFGRRFIGTLAKAREKAENQVSDVDRIRNNFVAFGDDLKEITKDIISSLFPVGVRLFDDLDLSDDCIQSLLLLLKAVGDQEGWALRMVDSYGRLPPGLLRGTTTDLGDLHECLDVEALASHPHHSPEDGLKQEQTTHKVAAFQGQYCLLNFKPLLPPKPRHLVLNHDIFNFFNTSIEGTAIDDFSRYLSNFYYLTSYKIGICIPSTCARNEVEVALIKSFEKLRLPMSDVGLGYKCILKDEPRPVKASQVVSIVIVAVLVILVMLGSLFDFTGLQIKRRGEQSVIHPLLLCFSLQRNTRKLLFVSYISSQTEDDQQPKTLNVIHGIRVIMMIWIVIINTYIFGGVYRIFWIYKNANIALEKMDSTMFQFILNGFISAETYFCLSGILLTYLLYPRLEESKGKLPYLKILCHRWVRLMPALVGAICLFFIWPFFGEGPVFESETQHLFHSCNNWWVNLFFANNWLPVQDIFILSSWYLSVEMQLYLIGPILVYVIHRNRKLGLRMTAFLAVMMAIISGTITLFYDIKPAVVSDHIIDEKALNRYLELSFLPTYQHLSSYCIGILVGYFIYNHRDYSFSKLTKWNVAIVFFALNVLAILIPVNWTGENNPHPIVAFTYATLSRPLWSLFIAWIVFASICGNFGFVNKVFSYRKLIPISRLTYSLSLIHLIPIYGRHYSVEHTQEWTHSHFLSSALINYCFALMLAYFVYVLFELPFICVENVIKKRIQHNSVRKLQSIKRRSTVNDIEC